MKDCQNKFKEELVSHLLEADPAASTLKAFGNTATLDGSILATLAGEHTGLAWSDLLLSALTALRTCSTHLFGWADQDLVDQTCGGRVTA